MYQSETSSSARLRRSGWAASGAVPNILVVRSGRAIPFLEVAMWTVESRALLGDVGVGQALSDDQYRLLAPLIPPPKPGGRSRATGIRRFLDGLFYVVRTGCQWRHLPPPPPFPPWSTAC